MVGSLLDAVTTGLDSDPGSGGLFTSSENFFF